MIHTQNIRQALVLGAFALTVTAQANVPDTASANAVQPVPGLTAESQWSNASDVELTRKIRQLLMQDRGLSVDAQNIKIITQNGRVTLRGLVRNGNEEEAVLAKARSLAGASQVIDQVQVRSAE